uniref:Peptidyl-prolyl cis-trans isomerase n=1 Tax=Eucampia antarctica TaxID=49252 RepID=A0A7S2VZY4_9STRA|mmetsp:Transcript_14569/g.14043  ORF Transcript_14569/g.14043 Transcript_14569/m.14043 type:complete len:185 (+) Transcript_14569:20-574(+)
MISLERIQSDTRRLLFIALLSSSLFSTVVCDSQRVDTASTLREIHRSWWLNDIVVTNGRTIPISPTTVVIFVTSIIYLYMTLTRTAKVEASHILLEGKDAKEKLEKYKKDIDNDPVKFAKHAETHSICPSGKNAGGSLGKFGPGSMVPAFDKVSFSKESPIKTVIGPIETTFGHHLIYIHSRTD